MPEDKIKIPTPQEYKEYVKKKDTKIASSDVSKNSYVVSPDILPSEKVNQEHRISQPVLDEHQVTRNIADQYFVSQFGEDLHNKAKIREAELTSSKVRKPEIEKTKEQKDFSLIDQKLKRYGTAIDILDQKLKELEPQETEFSLTPKAAYNKNADKIKEYKRQKKLIEEQSNLLKLKRPIEQAKKVSPAKGAEMERDLEKKSDRGRAMTYLGEFNSAVANMAGDIVKSAIVLPSQMMPQSLAPFPKELVQERVLNTALYKGVDKLKKDADKYFDGNPLIKEEFGAKITGGFGSLLAFMAGGAFGNGSKLATWAIPSLMGAGANAIPEMELAIEKTKDANELSKEDFITKYGDEKTDLVELGKTFEYLNNKNPMDVGSDMFWAAFGTGSLEGLPVMQFFKRLDKVSGGGVKKYMSNKGVDGIKYLFSKIDDTVIGKGVLGGLEEASQEITTNFLTNVSANKIYDSTRSLIDGLEEEGQIGGILGFITNTFVGILTKRAKMAKSREERKEINKTLEYVKKKQDEYADRGETEIVQKEPTQEVVELKEKELKIADDLANKDLTPATKDILEKELETVQGEIEKKQDEEREATVIAEAPIFEREAIENEIEELESSLKEVGDDNKPAIQKRIDELKVELEVEQPTTQTQTESTQTDESTPSEQEVEKQEPINPIRQLGTGANVYFETEKYRVNDSSGKVVLNIQNQSDIIPVANISFDNANDAVIIAKELDNKFPNGVPDALLVEKYVEDLKKQLLTNKTGKISVGGGEIGSKSYKEKRTQHPESKTREITIADGSKVKGKYKLVSADDVLASHNEETFAKSEGFPINDKGKTVNDRDYESDTSAQTEVVRIAGKLDNRAIKQTPVVTKDGIVVDGNNRTMSRKLAAKQGTDQEYLESLKNDADMYGFTAEQVESTKNPMLIFEAEQDIPYTTKEFARFNKAEKKEKSPIEKAVELSKTISDRARRIIGGIYEGATSPSDVTSNPKTMVDIRDLLLSEGVIQQNELPRYINAETGVATKDGVAFLETLLLGSALNENTIRMLDSDGMGAARNRILESIVQITQNAALKEDSLQDNIENGINLLQKANSVGVPVVNYISQLTLFDAVEYSPSDLAVAILLEGQGFKKFFKKYNSEVNTESLFEGTLTKEKLIDELLNDKIKQYEKIKQNLRPDGERGQRKVQKSDRDTKQKEGGVRETTTQESSTSVTETTNNAVANHLRSKADKLRDKNRPSQASFGLSPELLAKLYDFLADAVESGNTVANAIGKAIKSFDEFLEKNNIKLSADWDRTAFEKSINAETENYTKWNETIKDKLRESKGKATPQELKTALAETHGLAENEIIDSDFNDIYESSLKEYLAEQPTAKEVKKQVEKITKKESKEITTTEKEALKKQIRDFARGVRRGFIEGKAKVKDYIRELNEVKKQISKIISDNKVLLQQNMSANQFSGLINKVDKIRTPDSLLKAIEYIEKVIADSTYAGKLSKAKENIKKIKKIRKSKNSLASDKSIADAFLSIDPDLAENLDEYNEIAEQLLSGVRKPKISLMGVSDDLFGKTKSEVKKERTISNDDIQKYVKEQVEKQNELAKKKLKEEYSELFKDDTDLSFEEMQEIIDSVYNGELEEMMKGKTKAEVEEKLKTIRKYAHYKIIELVDAFTKETASPIAGETEYDFLSETEKRIFDAIKSIDTSNLTMKEAAMLVDIVENIKVNKDFSGAGQVEFIATKQQNIKGLRERFKKLGVTDVYKLRDNFRNALIQAFASFDLMIEFIIRHGKAASAIQTLMGTQDLIAGNSKVNQMQSDLIDGYKKLIKKFGRDMQTDKNKLIRGVYAYIQQHYGGTELDKQNEFNRLKNLVKENYEILQQSTDENLVNEGKILEEVYNEILEKSNNIKDVESKISDGNKEIVEYFKTKWAETLDDFAENNKIYNNNDLDVVNNYTSSEFKTIGKAGSQALMDDIKASVYTNKKINKRQSGTSKKRTKQNTLYTGGGLPGRVINFDFDYVQSKRYREANYEIHTQKARQLLSLMLDDAEFKELLGGSDNINAIYESVVNMINTQNGRRNVTPKELKAISTVLNVVTAKGVRAALGGVFQVAKQYISVAGGALVNLGTKADYFFRVPVNMPDGIYKYSGIMERGATQGGYAKQSKDWNLSQSSFGGAIKKFAEVVGEAGESVNKVIFAPLVGSDVAVAKRAFKSYYATYLVEEGIVKKFSDIDWNQEAKNPNKEASSWAEQMVSRTQNVNAFEKAAAAMKDDGGYGGFFRKLFMPFSGFSVNQRIKMTNDMQKILFGHEKGRALRSLGGTIGEIAIFNGIKLYGISVLTSLGADAILSFFGYEPEEKDEEKEKQYKKERYVSNLAVDFFFSGLGTLPENGLKYGVNKLYSIYKGKESEIIKRYKDDSEFADWGVYGILPKKIFDEFIPEAKMAITGETQKIVKGQLITNEESKEKVVFEPRNLSERERSLLVFLTFMDALNIAGVSDNDVNTMLGKVKRRLDKEMKKEYGKKTTIEMFKKGAFEGQKITPSEPI